MSFLLLLNIVKYGGRESLTRCTLGKHMQLHKAPADGETIFIGLTAHVLQIPTVQTTE